MVWQDYTVCPFSQSHLLRQGLGLKTSCAFSLDSYIHRASTIHQVIIGLLTLAFLSPLSSSVSCEAKAFIYSNSSAGENKLSNLKEAGSCLALFREISTFQQSHLDKLSSLDTACLELFGRWKPSPLCQRSTLLQAWLAAIHICHTCVHALCSKSLCIGCSKQTAVLPFVTEALLSMRREKTELAGV